MIVVIGNVKGGVGKTTLAINFAIARAAQGRDVLLIDGDEQGTALTFTAMYNSLSLVSHSGTSDFLLSRRKITQIISLAILKMSVFTDEARRTGSAH